MANEKRLIDANAIPESATAISTDGKLYVAWSAIVNAPTVDAVEVVHARWKNGDCTACGFDIRDMIDGESEFRSWVWECVPYCPNCGAKMDGGNKDETS